MNSPDTSPPSPAGEPTAEAPAPPEIAPGRRFGSNRELFLYACLRIRETRRYWLLPILALLVLVGVLLNVFAGYNVLPAIYSLIP